MSYETAVVLTLRQKDYDRQDVQELLDREPYEHEGRAEQFDLARLTFREVHNGSLYLEAGLKVLRVPFDTYYERDDGRWETQRVRYVIDGEVNIYLLSDEEAAERYQAIMQAAKAGIVAASDKIKEYRDQMASSPDLQDIDPPKPKPEPEQPLFRNFYRHDQCDAEWEDQWSCMCNDSCPKCGAEIEPYESEPLNEAAEKLM